MIDWAEIDRIEAGYAMPRGGPTLGRAFDRLIDYWKQGYRDRELALRLLFLAWYSCSEPGVLTGLSERSVPRGLIDDLVQELGGPVSGDDEVRFVLHVMAEVAPFCLGDPAHWAAIGDRMASQLGDRLGTMDLSAFENRGTYGRYFARVARAHAEAIKARQEGAGFRH